MALLPPVLLLFTRLPQPGRVKTRLIPALGPDGACTLHRALWADTLDLARRVRARTACEICVAWSGKGRPEKLLSRATFSGRLVEQRGPDLGKRLLHAHELLLGEGHPAVVTLGADSPMLSPEVVVEAFRRLADVDAVIAPADDGGYVLLGASRILPELFRDIPWGTSGVLAATRRALRATTASVAWLPSGFDVDDTAGLARLREELAAAPPGTCPATRRALAGLA